MAFAPGATRHRFTVDDYHRVGRGETLEAVGMTVAVDEILG